MSENRLAILINDMGGGGAERNVYLLLNYWSMTNWRLNSIFLITLEPTESVFSIPAHFNRKHLCKIKTQKNVLIKLILIPFLALRLNMFCREKNITTVISLLQRSNYVSIIASFLNKEMKAICCERTTPSQWCSAGRLQDKLHLFLIRKLYPFAHLVVANSRGVRDDLLAFSNIDGDKTKVINNPVNIGLITHEGKEKIPHEWYYKKDTLIMLTIGRLIESKGLDEMINIISEILKEGLEIKLVIVGEGQQRKMLEQIIGDLHLMKNVWLAGWQTNPFMYYTQSDFFFLNSTFEGFPNVLVEAMASGCPVISTNCQSGPAEILGDSEFGLLVPLDDYYAKYTAIKRYILSVELREYYSRKARKRATDYDIQNIALEYANLV